MQFIKETVIKAPPERVFDFHRLPDALERLIPPWEDAEIIQRADISVVGSRAIIDTKLFGLVTTRWVAEHTAYHPPHMFEDVQIAGPFSSWRHRHIVEPHEQGSVLRDEIEYEPPMWIFGMIAAPFLIVPKIERMFCYRHEVTRKWCES
jgi:ligand-binding SRPBCC domain-containing protein